MLKNNLDQEIEEEFKSLKKEEEKKYLKQAKIVYIVLIIALITSISSAVFAYVNYRRLINQNENTRSGIIIKYEDSAEYSTDKIVPGWVETKSKNFSVENNGRVEIEYNIELVKISSNLNSADSFGYSLYKNNVLVMENKLVPLNGGIILKSQLIKPGEKSKYKITFKSNSLIVSDVEISTKSFSGTFWIRIVK